MPGWVPELPSLTPKFKEYILKFYFFSAIIILMMNYHVDFFVIITKKIQTNKNKFLL